MRIARVFCHFKVPATRGHRDEDDRHAGQPFVNDNEASCAAAIEANHLDLMEKEQEAESVRSTATAGAVAVETQQHVWAQGFA